MNTIIRKFNPEDETQIKKCIQELKIYESQFDSDWKNDKESVDELYKDITTSKANGGEIFIAEVDKILVGFISLSIQNKNDELVAKKSPSVYISDVVVLPEYRNLGIGKQLLTKADDFAKEKMVGFIKLIVFSNSKKAIRLYKNMGFEGYELTMLKEI